MVQMETQLQSIFEEVVVSGTARDPGPWLGEGVARGQRPGHPLLDFFVVMPLLCATAEEF